MKSRVGARRLGCVVFSMAAQVLVALAQLARGQPPSSAQPEGLRQNTLAVHALVNVKVVLAPGRSIEKGTIVVRDGVIVTVGESDDTIPPADARVWDLAGRTFYPGLID